MVQLPGPVMAPSGQCPHKNLSPIAHKFTYQSYFAIDYLYASFLDLRPRCVATLFKRGKNVHL